MKPQMQSGLIGDAIDQEKDARCKTPDLVCGLDPQIDAGDIVGWEKKKENGWGWGFAG